jgi:hypothetical protein
MIDPFTHIGRVLTVDGKVRTMEVFYPEDEILLADGDEFITFTTVTDITRRPE